MHKAARALLGIIPVGTFFLLANAMRYVQDDAYITLTYARHVVHGHGAVFNIGEHVEGFTSILWMLIAAGATTISADPVAVLQTIGLLCGAATTLVVMRTALHVLTFAQVSDPHRSVLAALAATWLASISAMQFWSASAMEAPLFLFLVAGTVDAFLRRRDGWGWVMWGAVALLTRPEAMLLTGLLGGLRVLDVVQRRDTSRPWKQIGALIGVVAAIEAWRWLTYGALLPNTFAAKTTTLDVQVTDGLQYLWSFIRNVMGFGAGVLCAVIGAAMARRRDVTEILVIAVTWSIAVVMLGGDVLHHQRFVLPIAVITAPLIVLGLVYAMRRLKTDARMQWTGAATVLVGLCIHAATAERAAIEHTIRMEGELVNKMKLTGLFLRNVGQREGRTLTIAATTIGALKWWSQQHVIDMLGLTDRTIATQPRRIEIVSDDASVSWKERNYNADYVLGRKPDYIVFSTGMKPSAFAERALFARQFYVDYYQYYYEIPSSTNLQIMYRRKPDVVLKRSPQRRMELTDRQLRRLNDYARALELLSAPAGYAEADRIFDTIATQGPPNFSGAWQQRSDMAMTRRDERSVVENAQHAVTIDPCDIRAHFTLFQFHRSRKDSVNTTLHGDWIARCNPVLFKQLGINVPDDAY